MRGGGSLTGQNPWPNYSCFTARLGAQAHDKHLLFLLFCASAIFEQTHSHPHSNGLKSRTAFHHLSLLVSASENPQTPPKVFASAPTLSITCDLPIPFSQPQLQRFFLPAGQHAS
jgi:hypothetical protein